MNQATSKAVTPDLDTEVEPSDLASLSARTVSLVLPVYNEEDALQHLIHRLEQLQQTVPRLREILFVDDGSTDDSFSLLRTAVDTHDGWRLLRFSRNFGQQAASLAGIQHARADAVVLMDADLQDPPELIGSMIERWDEGWDVVYGVQRQRAGEGVIKHTLSKMFYRLLARLSDLPIPVDAGDFRLMDAKVVAVNNQLGEQRPYVRGLVTWAGFRQTSIDFDREPRRVGSSNYNFGKVLSLSIDAIIGYS